MFLVGLIFAPGATDSLGAVIGGHEKPPARRGHGSGATAAKMWVASGSIVTESLRKSRAKVRGVGRASRRS